MIENFVINKYLFIYFTKFDIINKYLIINLKLFISYCFKLKRDHLVHLDPAL